MTAFIIAGSIVLGAVIALVWFGSKLDGWR
jgi:hypothetical protein